MSEHTPGPWKSGAHATIPGRFAIRHESGGVIVGHTWDEANARLIAAAPELLEALKALDILLDFAEPASDDKPMMFDDYGPLNQAFEKALQAIAKASADNGAVSE